MADFQFSLDSLLTYRRFQRDQCRQLLAEVLAEQTEGNQQVALIASERSQIEAGIRQGNQVGQIDVQRSATSRYYLSQLDSQKRLLEMQLTRTEQQLALCRLALQQADAAVKALEQLREKRWQTYQQQQRKRNDLELQEAWAVTHHFPQHPEQNV